MYESLCMCVYMKYICKYGTCIGMMCTCLCSYMFVCECEIYIVVCSCVMCVHRHVQECTGRYACMCVFLMCMCVCPHVYLRFW